MKREKNYLKKLSLVALIILSAMLTAAMAYRHGRQVPPELNKKAGEHQREHHYDPALLQQLERLGATLDFNKAHCTYAGSINIDDGADSAASAHHIEFFFCRSQKNYYYRLGNTETVHEDGINLFIEHGQKKVVLSRRDITVRPAITDLAAIEKMLRYEDYDLVAVTEAGNKKLSLLNPTHITCKELSLTCDTLTGRLQKIETRLSNIADALNRKKDRVVAVTVTEMEESAHLPQQRRLRNILAGGNGNWHLKPDYATYELIVL